MLAWLLRGLAKARVTTRYPARPEPPPPSFRGPIELIGTGPARQSVVALCPTGAITSRADWRYVVDRGRCIQCGACVRADPDSFRFAERYETASRRRDGLLVGVDDSVDDHRQLETVRAALGEQVAALRRSIHIRHVDAGSDGAEEWEIAALLNPYYDVQRLGLFFTASPRHADVLLVTGGVTQPMRSPLERAYAVMPSPKAIVAVGTDACSGGLADATGATCGGVDEVLPVDVFVPGSPPAPIAILHGLLLAVGALREVAA
jgi:Ni,Fe-hydrogenase III small subunit/formate hydrogenlyase subunit 6/NADH:ubiquinone oxidoreductase subunit I